MTGFKLSWSIVAADATTGAMAASAVSPAGPAPAAKSRDKHRPAWLARMVGVARQARLDNMTRQQTLLKTLQLKVFNTDFSNLYDKCDSGQLVNYKQKELLSIISSAFNKGHLASKNDDIDIADIEHEDLKTGVMIYYTIALCQIRA